MIDSKKRGIGRSSDESHSPSEACRRFGAAEIDNQPWGTRAIGWPSARIPDPLSGSVVLAGGATDVGLLLQA